MVYSFKISFPGSPRVTLRAATKNEADAMERALITLKSDYVIVGPEWIGGSFRMTTAAHQVLDRLAPLQRSRTHFQARNRRNQDRQILI
jgi:putative salt-induced outer membrane protein YdiY